MLVFWARLAVAFPNIFQLAVICWPPEVLCPDMVDCGTLSTSQAARKEVLLYASKEMFADETTEFAYPRALSR